MNTQITGFSIDDMVNALRTAAVSEDPGENVKTALQNLVANPGQLAASMPVFDDKDVVLFEDETVSIWYCRFTVGQTVPAHDHQMLATVAVYDGIERNEIWRRDKDGHLQKTRNINVKAGEVLQMNPDDIHSVSCGSEIDSQAIHVYLGKLTTVARSLFNPADGKAMRFDDENYYQLTRSS